MEKNQTVAEFMGWKHSKVKNYYLVPKQIEFDWYNDVGNIQIHVSNLRFHKSWHWLKPVIDKIYSIIKDKYPTSVFEIGTLNLSASIENAYDACINFIEFHNQSHA